MKILIIEDDKKTAEFIAGAFRQSGYITTLCTDGEEGAAAALHGEYDAAVIDIMLPRKAGLSIIRDLRAAGRLGQGGHTLHGHQPDADGQRRRGRGERFLPQARCGYVDRTGRELQLVQVYGRRQ